MIWKQDGQIIYPARSDGFMHDRCNWHRSFDGVRDRRRGEMGEKMAVLHPNASECPVGGIKEGFALVWHYAPSSNMAIKMPPWQH